MKPFLTILKNLYNDEVFSALALWQEQKDEASRAAFLSALYERDAQNDLSAYLAEKILYDENAFSRASAKKARDAKYIDKAFEDDLREIYALVTGIESGGSFNRGNVLRLGNEQKDARRLKKKYRKYGYGKFLRYRAFRYVGGELRPVEHPSCVQLTDLKDYKEEKATIISNVENFLDGLPYSDMLLYGERGTGKSSTVHAVLNEYFEKGLRLVELSKENILDLGRLKEFLQGESLKFIIFVDDLSIAAGDERISSLKAALEGGAEGNTDNAMIVATTNRRHIVDETFSRREDSVHAGDNMQEELSLSDRFGISVLFGGTDKKGYLSIVNQLAADKGVTLPKDQLELLAERWALVKGGRSPRRAEQFVNLAYSCERKGKPIIF